MAHRRRIVVHRRFWRRRKRREWPKRISSRTFLRTPDKGISSIFSLGSMCQSAPLHSIALTDYESILFSKLSARKSMSSGTPRLARDFTRSRFIEAWSPLKILRTQMVFAIGLTNVKLLRWNGKNWRRWWRVHDTLTSAERETMMIRCLSNCSAVDAALIAFSV